MVRTPSSEGPFNAQFKVFADELDTANDKRERLVKASRDVTRDSKKAIFSLHRANPSNKPAILSSAAASLAALRKVIASRIVSELDCDSAARFHRAYSPGLQEYIEARTFHAFLSDGTLLAADHIQSEIRAAYTEHRTNMSDVAENVFVLDNADYVLGVADLTGELMRVAIAAAARADRNAVRDVWVLMNHIDLAFKGLHKYARGLGRDYPSKLKTLANSISKVERSACDLAVRAAEFGDDLQNTQHDAPLEPSKKRIRAEQY
ncbi:unnamed protein product [Chondrus crispus]|uniref:Translin n=1 Tax=Chondrus crispus TaxID=2769 RepID=R7Q6T0_CHOCR|nr:unnamed protein product [Chondrus crispus]CDF33744.1 unnamed protein product [Chondrus crispus]|eukprot:XP_005713563.1 unnamed protein product [Chondrus crispus]